jgi:hypothetical protein
MSNQEKLKLPIPQDEYGKLVNECLDVIKKYNVLFINDLVTFLPFARSTFYYYKLDKSDFIKSAISDQRILTKQGLRARWANSNAPALQIALYKLIATPEERQTISNGNSFEDITIEEAAIKKAKEVIYRNLNDPATAKWLLERKCPNEFGPKAEMKTTNLNLAKTEQSEIDWLNALINES